jgi:hypothetical protein
MELEKVMIDKHKGRGEAFQIWKYISDFFSGRVSFSVHIISWNISIMGS